MKNVIAKIPRCLAFGLLILLVPTLTQAQDDKADCVAYIHDVAERTNTALENYNRLVYQEESLDNAAFLAENFMMLLEHRIYFETLAEDDALPCREAETLNPRVIALFASGSDLYGLGLARIADPINQTVYFERYTILFERTNTLLNEVAVTVNKYLTELSD